MERRPSQLRRVKMCSPFGGSICTTARMSSGRRSACAVQCSAVWCCSREHDGEHPPPPPKKITQKAQKPNKKIKLFNAERSKRHNNTTNHSVQEHGEAVANGLLGFHCSVLHGVPVPAFEIAVFLQGPVAWRRKRQQQHKFRRPEERQRNGCSLRPRDTKKKRPLVEN